MSPTRILEQYGCRGIHFHGGEDALYERHLLFDHAVDAEAASARERFEALARSVRDVLAQRGCARTGPLPERANPA